MRAERSPSPSEVWSAVMNPLVQTEWSLVIRAEMWGAREQRAVALCGRQPTTWITKQKGGPELGLHATA